ncbi:MAG: hypothetical protein LBT10_02055 [Methanobrevibacter sp.]|jgi:hypothetical protein|nr:hypothetical protein [Methanobrevibacter sp.]
MTATPHIITEFSNLNKHDHYKVKLFEKMMDLIENKYINEEFIEIRDIIKDKDMKSFGVTDIAISKISKNVVVESLPKILDLILVLIFLLCLLILMMI